MQNIVDLGEVTGKKNFFKSFRCPQCDKVRLGYTFLTDWGLNQFNAVTFIFSDYDDKA